MQRITLRAALFTGLQFLHFFLPGCTNVALVSVSRDTCLVSVFGQIEGHGCGFRNRHGPVHAALIKLV